MFAVKVENLCKTYQIGEIQLKALGGISFQVDVGEMLAVVGESGSGKSTLLHVLGTLDSPSSGKVFIKGSDPFEKSDKELSSFRSLQVGFVFQNNNLLSEFSAIENVMMPGLIAGVHEKKIRQKAENLLETVGLINRKHHFPSQLSGGEQQRAAIARALINDPALILADEPSGSLDSYNAKLIHELFFAVNEKLKSTILIVTHNKNFANQLPRRIVLRDGLIVNDECVKK